MSLTAGILWEDCAELLVQAYLFLSQVICIGFCPRTVLILAVQQLYKCSTTNYPREKMVCGVFPDFHGETTPTVISQTISARHSTCYRNVAKQLCEPAWANSGTPQMMHRWIPWKAPPRTQSLLMRAVYLPSRSTMEEGHVHGGNKIGLIDLFSMSSQLFPTWEWTF